MRPVWSGSSLIQLHRTGPDFPVGWNRPCFCLLHTSPSAHTSWVSTTSKPEGPVRGAQKPRNGKAKWPTGPLSLPTNVARYGFLIGLYLRNNLEPNMEKPVMGVWLMVAVCGFRPCPPKRIKKVSPGLLWVDTNEASRNHKFVRKKHIKHHKTSLKPFIESTKLYENHRHLKAVF